MGIANKTRRRPSRLIIGHLRRRPRLCSRELGRWPDSSKVAKNLLRARDKPDHAQSHRRRDAPPPPGGLPFTDLSTRSG
jgi:hypothetical protein